jgi:WD40 repeat protein
MIKLWDPRLKGKGDYAADSSGPVACVYRIPTGSFPMLSYTWFVVVTLREFSRACMVHTGLGKVMCLQANNSKLFVGGDSDRKHNFPIFVYNLQKLTGTKKQPGSVLICVSIATRNDVAKVSAHARVCVRAGVVRQFDKSLIPCSSSDSYAILKESEFMGHSDRIWTLQASLGRLVTGAWHDTRLLFWSIQPARMAPPRLTPLAGRAGSRDGNVRVWNYSHCPNATESVDKKESGSYILGKPHQRYARSPSPSSPPHDCER